MIFCRLQLHLAKPLHHRGPLVGGARGGQPGQPDDGVPGPGDALVELDDDAVHRSAAGRACHDGVGQVVERAQVLHPERVRHADLGEHPAAAGLGAERRQPRVGAVHRDAQRERDVALELGRVVRASRCERAGLGISAAIRASSRGRSSSFSLSDRGEASCTATRDSRARAWLGITPGSSAR